MPRPVRQVVTEVVSDEGENPTDGVIQRPGRKGRQRLQLRPCHTAYPQHQESAEAT